MENNMKKVIFYEAPDGSTISLHDYQFLSTSQQQQCKAVYGSDSIFIDGDFNQHSYSRIYQRDFYKKKK